MTSGMAKLDSATPVDAAAESNASALCVDCGLCCTGVLFTHAPCNESETGRMEALGLTIGRIGDRPHFKLPCLHNHDGRCGIYAQRFTKCRTFRCELLQRLDSGQVSAAEAHSHVGTAKDLLGRVTALDPRASQATFRREVRAAGSPGPAQARLWLESLALETFLDRHFRKLSAIAWPDDSPNLAFQGSAQAMTQLESTRISLPTGITLKVAQAGPSDAPAIIFLHGFPESHRTWRHVAPALAGTYRVIIPDQRGFGGSDKPEGVDAYRAQECIADLFALADACEIDRFTLVGHDWGGAIAWGAALTRPERLERLVIVNAPHPHIFQRSLIDNPAQRAASQYINAFRGSAMERAIEAMGIGTFFDKSFGGHVDLAAIPADERQAYLDDWSQPGALTAMLNWYRASPLVVPAVGEDHLPVSRDPLPNVTIPTLVIWGMRDKALLPVQLDDLDRVVDDLTIQRIEDAGHFVPWEKPEPVTAAIRAFIESRPAPSP